jgi:hypothetical protein
MKLRDKALYSIWFLPHEVRRVLFRIAQPQSYRALQELRHIVNDKDCSLKPFDEHKCIFVHIPKCAGTSICKSLFGNLAGSHTSIMKYQLIFSKSEFDSYFKFTFVRNPWDRLVSAYFFLKSGGSDSIDRKWANENLSSYDNFDIFVKKWIDRKNIHTWLHFYPQYKYICDIYGKIQVDFIGLFENIENDFSYIKNQIGSSSNLLFFNKNKIDKKDYKKYFSKETKEIVAQAYREDIELLGYEFDNYKFNKFPN